MSTEMCLLILFFVLFLAYAIYDRINSLRVFTKLGIPGPKPNFFVGNMMQMMGKGKLVTEVMTEWESRYGKYYGYFRGVRPALVVRDAEVIKDILVKNAGEFINRPHMVMNVPPIPETVVGLRSQRWKDVRHTLSPAFSSAKIKQMIPIMENCVQTTITILKEKYKSSNRKEQIVDAHKLFKGLACDVICACALAMKVDSQRNANNRFYNAVTGFLDNAMGPFVKTALCFPFLAKIMSWSLTTFGYSHEMTTMIMSSVRTEMKVRRGKKEVNGNTKNENPPPRDALQLMMESQTDSSTISDDEIVANAWVFILGGFETTSSSLSYTCHLLSTHQDIQEKLFRELKDSFQLKESPDYEKISGLTYLDQVICESLRLYPPVVNFIVRGLEKDGWVGPFFVPKHISIQIPVWQIHHDNTIWPEPYAFDPSRFDNNAKKVLANNMQWIPFGSGPRSCIGARFALLNMKFTLCSILRKFKILPASVYEPHNLKLKVPSVTLVPDNGVPIRFIPRED